MAFYDWIKIDKPSDYEQLYCVLDGDFEPTRIVKKLKANITCRVKAVLVEHDYLDKDYRSTFYNFYAKKGRPYRTDCVRLHFFDEHQRNPLFFGLMCPVILARGYRIGGL